MFFEKFEDHLSGTAIETDEKGNVIGMTGYKNPYKFTGKELDADIGLYYYGARYYNPAIGRFVSIDPWEGDLKDPQTLNKYSYVMNNPLRYIDPTGETGEAFEKAWKKAKEKSNPLSLNNGSSGEGVLSANNSTSNFIDNSNFVSGPIDEFGNPKQYDFSGITDVDDIMGAGITAGLSPQIRTLGEILGLIKRETTSLNKNPWQSAGITPGEAKRIQNAADKIKKNIYIVGSRAKGNATEISDWDYIIEGMNKNIRHKIKNSLPKGTSGGELIHNKWTGIDINKGPLIKGKPFIKFKPKKIK